MDETPTLSGVLPIVSRGDAQQILGIVTFSHIMQFMRSRTLTSGPPFDRPRINQA
jgi:hypothetical protein